SIKPHSTTGNIGFAARRTAETRPPSWQLRTHGEVRLTRGGLRLKRPAGVSPTPVASPGRRHSRFRIGPQAARAQPEPVCLHSTSGRLNPLPRLRFVRPSHPPATALLVESAWRSTQPQAPLRVPNLRHSCTTGADGG